MHGKVLCSKCGKIIRQCRCMCNSIPTYEVCEECATKKSGTQPTDVQQLKAEIAALVNRHSHYYIVQSKADSLDIVLDELRKLSAV